MIARCMTVMILALIGCFVPGSALAEDWSVENRGWSVRGSEVNGYRFWVLRHEDRRTSIMTVFLDKRQDIPFAEAFERLKAERGELDNCPGLITADTEPEHDPFAEAMLAVTKVKDPDAYAAMDKDLPVIGYHAMDDVVRPNCILVAREYTRGGVLVGWIGDDSGRLASDGDYLSNIVRSTIDDINEREALQAPAKPEPPKAEDACEDTIIYNDWVVSWSPKSAIVYVRDPELLDARGAGKKLRFGFSVGGNVDPAEGRQELYYGLVISAEDDGQGFVPQKRSLSVDGQTVQEWSSGGGQWATLSDEALHALFSGDVAVMETEELGRFSFPLSELEPLLQIADVGEQKAVVQKQLGMCQQ